MACCRAGLEGLEVFAALRGTGNITPVMVLSALSDVTDRVRGLRAGGDDYLTKPFDFLELTARVNALIRCPHATGGRQEAEIVVGDLHIDLISRAVRRAGRPFDLLPREFSLRINDDVARLVRADRLRAGLRAVLASPTRPRAATATGQPGRHHL